jgi:CheY-like chemotaxis protein
MSVVPTILYAEDDENDVFFVKRAFGKLQFDRMDVVENGRDAMEYLRRTGDAAAARPLPAVMLLDLNLPFYGGHEVLTWIRERREFESLPVIIFTSSAQLTDIERAYREGATAYVVKPSAAPVMVDFARHILRAIATPADTRTALSACPGWQPPR